MNKLNDKLKILKNKINNNEKIKIAIIGLGSVGNYLLNYLLSKSPRETPVTPPSDHSLGSSSFASTFSLLPFLRLLLLPF